MFVDWLGASNGRRTAARAFGANVVITGLAVAVVAFGASSTAGAKGPGQTYCFYKKCHRVKTIAETQALVGRDLRIVASHYDSCKKDRFNPCGLTSSGERFAPERADNAASPVLPDGTIALVWSKQTKEAIVIRINNAGPYWGNRQLDLSRAAARKLGIGGVGEVTLRVLKAPTPAEARYAKNRRYDPVPGPIGQFASLDEAHSTMSTLVAQGSPDTTALAGLAPPAATAPATDLALDLSSAFSAPVVPGLTIPKGALAEALIAQSTIERRSVTASVPPSTNVAVLTPKIPAAKTVVPRRTRVEAVEVKPKEPDALEAVATLVTSLIEPPKPVRVAKRSRSAASKAGEKKPVAKPKAEVAQAPRREQRVRVAQVERPEEFRAGFTTYAEERYRTTPKFASLQKPKPVRAKSKSTTGSLPETQTNSGPVKQAGVSKGKKQAAIKKSGGWQSSALGDVPVRLPQMTTPHPRVPAGEMKDETEQDQRPRLRVHPSALV
ncbi:MAG: septal ring lytic transglycosylase RlpA family protein [Hyphomicrobium sp.]|nr:septal ring lytic transglycosylase RlpA family protein [Hyphomicrobium sp.]